MFPFGLDEAIPQVLEQPAEESWVADFRRLLQPVVSSLNVMKTVIIAAVVQMVIKAMVPL